MKITQIREQKNGRFAIYADGEYRLSADAQTIALNNLHCNAEISEDELETFAKSATEQFAKDKALTLLSYRDHSKEELKRKLERSVDEETADMAATRMEELGLVDDNAFAEKFAREMLFKRLYGKSRVLYEMEKKGLDRELSREIVEQLDLDSARRAKNFIEKKYPRGIADEKIRRRAVSALQRNGYRWDDIKEALRALDEEQDLIH